MIKQGHFKGQQSQSLANIAGFSNSREEGVQYPVLNKTKDPSLPSYPLSPQKNLNNI